MRSLLIICEIVFRRALLTVHFTDERNALAIFQQANLLSHINIAGYINWLYKP